LPWQLNNLINKGLLQDSNFSSERIGIHDLYIEFARLEVEGKFDKATNMCNRRWVNVVVDDGDFLELEVILVGSHWEKLSQLSIQHINTHVALPIQSQVWRELNGSTFQMF